MTEKSKKREKENDEKLVRIEPIRVGNQRGGKKRHLLDTCE
jgi:hypothetical protein